MVEKWNLHRDNELAAIIYHDGRKEWWKNGILRKPILPVNESIEKIR